MEGPVCKTERLSMMERQGIKITIAPNAAARRVRREQGLSSLHRGLPPLFSDSNPRRD